MSKYAVLLVCLVEAPGTRSPLFAQGVADSAADRAFEVSSVGSGYPFVAALRGVYRVYRDSIVVEITRGAIVSQVPARFGEEGTASDVTLRVGLGSGSPDSWRFLHESGAESIGVALVPEAELRVTPLRFMIAGSDTIPVAARWLAFQIGVKQRLPGLRAGRLVTYVCTEDYLLGPTPASVERARRQRAEYSRVC